MSDSESFNSATPGKGIIDQAAYSDDVLNDHRHQPASLPIRTGIQFAESPITDSEDEDVSKQDEGNKRSESQTSKKRKQRESPVEGLTGMSPGGTRSGAGKPLYMNTLRTEFYLKNNDEEEESGLPIIVKEGSGFSEPRRKNRAPIRTRSHSISEPPKTANMNLDEADFRKPPTSPGILINSANSFSRRKSRSNSNSYGDAGLNPMMKVTTNDTNISDNQVMGKKERRPSRSSIDSEADSHASRSSQETEEDVCFPMLREHVRVKGIDFDEIEEFIKDEQEEELRMKEQQQIITEKTAFRVQSRMGRSTGSIMRSSSATSSAALKYTPKDIIKKTNKAFKKIRSRTKPFNEDSDSLKSVHSYGKGHSDSSTIKEELDEKDEAGVFSHDRADDISSTNVKFGGTRVNDGASVLPDRFSFFSSESEETIHAPDIPSLVEPDQSVKELFKNGEGTWWLDCVCPTDAEMKMLAKAFGIHPLTAEDIRMQETREKVELFKSYYFVCFHTFEPDRESEDYLEPINVYIVVFRDGVLSFHFSPVLHPANVRRRVRQLRDYVDVSADWLCYALIDDITDGFAPIITAIEYEADAIEDSVFVARDSDFSNMLQRIGEARRKVMTLMRLLSGKADVIKMFAKRCQDEAAVFHSSVASHSNVNTLNASSGSGQVTPTCIGGVPNINVPLVPNAPQSAHFNVPRAQPRADIALYLGDIQDHVVTMFQNLVAYEKIFSRSHSNYLAQLQVESFNSNNRATEMLSKVTLIGTMLVPLNLVTGLFGMNVKVPGQDDGDSNLSWFFGIMGVMGFIIICFFCIAKIWIARMDDGRAGASPLSSRRSIRSLGIKSKAKEAARSIVSFPTKYD